MDPVVHHLAAHRCHAGAYTGGWSIYFYAALAGIFGWIDDWMQNSGKGRAARNRSFACRLSEYRHAPDNHRWNLSGRASADRWGGHAGRGRNDERSADRWKAG